MDKKDWDQTNRALLAASTRLTAEIKKQTDSLQLSGVPDGSDATQHRRNLFAAVADANFRLRGIQKQIAEGQPTPSFIQSLAAHISGFTELLNTLKASQRQQYASLLQQEQQLLEELQTVQIADDFESPQHHWYSETDGYEEQPGSFHEQHMDAVGPRHRHDSPNKHRLQRQDSTETHQHPAVGGAKTPRRSSTGSTSSSGPPAAHSNSTLLPEVVAYDNFLAKHGPTGGWHPDDHNTFMAILRSNRGDYSAAVPAAADALPMHTRHAILAHCRWHADLMELDMKRRVALVNWRTARDAAKSAMLAEAKATMQDTSHEVQQPAHDQVAKEVRQLQKQRVEHWKQQKQQAAQQQAQLEAMRQQQEQERQQRELQEKRAALKQRLEAMKAVKQQQIAASAVPTREPSGASSRGSLSRESSREQQELQQRLLQRSSATLERRQQLVAAKAEKQAAREKVQQQLLAELEPSRPKVDRDPSRLLAATATAAAKAAGSEEPADTGKAADTGALLGRGSIPSGFVLHLGHKAVPAWASGMR